MSGRAGWPGRDAPCRWLWGVLVLAAVHSAAVGVGLIALPSRWLPAFGLAGEAERFFRAQGGVFHLLMAYAYLLAARRLPRAELLVHLAIVVKGTACVFLVLYAVLVSSAWVVVASAAGDGAFAVLLVLARARCRRADAGQPGG